MNTKNAERESLFDTRLKKSEPELHELYRSLYGDTPEYEALLSRMRERYEARSEELKELDIRREADPDWYRSPQMLGMTMYPQLFAGGLKGLIRHLDYLSEQKITYLHLMPLLKMPHPQNDGGYAVEDFKTVDPTIGTNEELEALTAELRRRGISLCLDIVMNHTADSHEWAKKAKAGDPTYQAYYQCYDTYDIPAQFEKTMPQVFPATAPGNFTWNEQMHKYVLTTFYPFQWDLNYQNPRVFSEMADVILFLANEGVEVLRIDAVPYIWKQLGTNCRNLPQVHTIVRMIRIMLEAVCPAVILKGEVVMAPKELPAYFGTPEKPECHMLYGNSEMVNLWSALAASDTRLLNHLTDELNHLPDNCYFVNYIRCHDDIGWGLEEDEEHRLGIDPFLHKEYLYHFYEGVFPGSYARGQLYNYDPITKDARTCGTSASLCGIEKGGFEGDLNQVVDGIRRDLLMHAACMSLGGFMMLSSGDEIGQVNDYSYMNDPERAADSRNLHRSPFNWVNAAKRRQPGTVQFALWNGLKKMEEIRRNEPCFGKNAALQVIQTESRSVFVLRRRLEHRELLCVANFSDRAQIISIPGESGRFTDLFTGGETDAAQFFVDRYAYRWVVRE